MSATDSTAAWVAAFNEKLRLKTFEQFSLLLCDLARCEPRQRELLSQILFDDARSAELWCAYIEYCVIAFGDRKLQLQRLINKALEVLNEAENRDRPAYVQIHLFSAQLKNDAKDSLRYFQHIIGKKDIGRRLAAVYLAWANLEQLVNGKPAAIEVVRRGLAEAAEPRQLLEKRLNELIDFDASSRSLLDEEVEINYNPKQPQPQPTAQPQPLPLHSHSQSQQQQMTTTTRRSSTGEEKVEAAESVVDLDKTIQVELKPKRTATTGRSGDSQRSLRPSSSASSSFTIFDSSAVAPTATSSRPSRLVPSEEAPARPSSSEAVRGSSSVPLASSASESASGQRSKRSKRQLAEVEASPGLPEVKRARAPEPTTSANSHSSDRSRSSTKSRSRSHRSESRAEPESGSAMEVEPVAESTKGAECSANPNVAAEETCLIPLDELLQQAHPVSPAAVTAPASAFAIAGTTGTTAKASPPSVPAAQETVLRPTASRSETIEHPPRKVTFKDQEPSDARLLRADSARASSSSSSSFAIASASAATSAATSAAVSTPAMEALGAFSDILDPSKRICVNQRSYLPLTLLGKGGSSSVFKVLSPESQCYAFKRVNIKSSGASDEENDHVFESFSNEIRLLNQLKMAYHQECVDAGVSAHKNPYIIELVDAELNREEMFVSMVLELGDVDLSKVLSQGYAPLKEKKGAVWRGLNPFRVRLIWQEILQAVHYIHKNRIVHGDLKPANFVFVQGHLKLIDFGIAKTISNDTTNIYRDSQIGTVNYMAPEAITPMALDMMDTEEAEEEQEGAEEVEAEENQGEKGAKGAQGKSSRHDGQPRMRLGRASDVWSLGCILYQMIYGKPPFAHLNMIQKLSAIPNSNVAIAYPETSESIAVQVIQSCLRRNPRERATIPELLSHRFLTLEEPPAAVPQPVAQPVDSPVVSATSQLQPEVVLQIAKLAAAAAGSKTSSPAELCGSIGKLLGLSLDPALLEQANREIELPVVKEAATETNASFVPPCSVCANLPSHLPAEGDPSKKVRPSPPAFLEGLFKERKPLATVSTQSLLNKENQVGPVNQVPFAKQPMQPNLLVQQIKSKLAAGLDNAATSTRAEKWMKPKASPQKEDLRSVLEKRIANLRKFLGDEADPTCHDFTEGNSFF